MCLYGFQFVYVGHAPWPIVAKRIVSYWQRSKNTYPSIKQMQSPHFLTNTSSNNNTKDKKASSHLKVLIMNCQSIIGKKAIFDNLIDCYKPEIVVGTES